MAALDIKTNSVNCVCHCHTDIHRCGFFLFALKTEESLHAVSRETGISAGSLLKGTESDRFENKL